MSLRLCIPGMVERGEITSEQGADMARVYGELELQYRQQMSPAAAAAAASEEALRKMEITAELRRRQDLLQARAQKGALAAIASFDGGKGLDGGVLNPRAAEALFDFDDRAPYANVESRRKAIRGRAHAEIDRLLSHFRSNVIGQMRHRADMADVVRELFGQSTGNLNAKELADSWSRTAEMLRKRFNAAGGAIGKLEGWGLPQSHDSRGVREAGFNAWRDFIWDKLDRARMIDDATGLPFSDAKLELALRDVFETIRTEGWSKREPGGVGQGKLANRRAEHRFLHFDGADNWFAYHERFGQGDPFAAMMTHIDAMSRDIAMMEILGPNPSATVKWIKDGLEKSAAVATEDKGRAGEAARAGAMRVQRLYDEITGELRRPESRRLALGFSSVRSLQTSAKLGSATLSAVSDVGFQMFTRRANGMRASRAIGDYLKLLRPGAEEDRKLAIRLGLIAEEWASHTAAQHRYLTEELTGEVSRRLAETTLRVSGLSHFTQSGRWAFGMETLGFMTSQMGKPFGDLHPGFRRTLERYGIGADRWAAIGKEAIEVHKGVPWLNPTKFADEALGDRVLQLINTETDFAVPTADLRTRAMFDSFAPRGTWIGEIARSALLFKSFGVSVMMLHGRRMLQQQGAFNRARYAAGLMMALTAGGALALQLKEVAKGKDPRPMFDEENAGNTAAFWGAAMLQGGGFGIFGDFLQASENRFGGGFAATAAGPLIGDASDLGNIVVGNASRAVQGEDTRVGADALRFAKGEIPIASSLWYTRLGFERLLLDELQSDVDPNYRQAWRRMRKRAEKSGQEYYWAPGEPTPDRAPDFGNVLTEGGQ